MILQLVAIAGFYLLILGVGIYAGRQRSGTSDELMLAGRSIPLWICVFTMTATWVGGGFINGTAEMVFDAGLVWAQAPWGYALSLILGGVFFARIMRRHRFTTMLDPFDRRYGKQITALLFIPAVIGDIFWSAAILTALGTTFSIIIGFDLTTSILISAALAVGYTMIGGLRSVAYTDVLQLVFILIGLGIAIPFVLDHVGGIGAAWNRYTDLFQENAALFPPMRDAAWHTQRWIWIDYALLLICGGIPWQVYFQRVLASSSETSAMMMSIAAGFGCVLLAVPAVLMGAAGSVADWSAVSAGAPEQPALVLPWVLQYLTPPVVAIIGLGAVAAAVTSSVDSSILSAGSMFTWNVYRPLVRPDASPEQLGRTVRVGVLVIGGLSTALALSVQSVYTLWFLCADLVYVVLFPQLVMVLYSRIANRWGVVAGAAIGLVLRLGGGEPALGLPALIDYPMTDADGVTSFPFRTVAMLTSLATIWVVSLATQRLQVGQPLVDVSS